MLLRQKYRYGIVFIAFLSVIIACNNQPKESVEVLTKDDDMMDFESFYKQFHKDPTYQLEHITFPLEGMPGLADSLLVNHGKFYYEKAGWKHMNYVDWDTSQLNRILEPTGLGVINEYICTNDRFCMTRRFAKLSNGWHLIYYANFNYRPDIRF